MLEEGINQFYDEFERTYSLNKREAQRKASFFFALPLYKSNVKNVVGEGKTGIGKTISYLVPLAMARLQTLPPLPAFVVKEPKKYLFNRDLSSQEKIEALLEEYAREKNYEIDIEAEFKTLTPRLEKAFIVTATKMLQNQIVNKDLVTINDFIAKKGGQPFNYAVTIGKKNYICKSQIQKISEKLQKKIEEVEELNKLAKEKGENIKVEDFKQEVANIIQILEQILSNDDISSLDDLLKVLGYENYQKVINFLNDYEELDSFYAPSTVQGLGLIFEDANFLREDKENLIKFLKKISYFLSVENVGVTKCTHCNSGKCSYRDDILALQKADIVIMNYHYFASIFLRKMAFLNSSVRELEKLFKMKIENWTSEKLQKELTKLLGDIFSANKKKTNIDKFVLTLINLKNYYEKNVKHVYYIFDEAHNFEKDLLSSLTQTFDFNEFCKLIEKNRTKLMKILEKNPLFYGSNVYVDFFEKLIITEEAFTCYDRTMKNVLQALKEKWQTGNSEKDVLKEVAILFTENFFQMAFTDKKFQSFLVRQVLAKGEIDDYEVRKIYDEVADHFKQVLFSSDSLTKEMISVAFLQKVIETIKKDIQSLIFLHQQCKDKEKQYLAKGEEVPLGNILLVKKFPSSAFKNLLKQSEFLSKFIQTQFLLNYQKATTFKLAEIKEFEKQLKQFNKNEQSSFAFKMFKDFYEGMPTGLISKIKQGKISTGMEGLTWYLLEENIENFLNHAFLNWKEVPKILTSATIVDDMEKMTQGTKGFSFFLKGTGLENVQEESILTFVSRSHFNYEKNARLYIPEDLPDIKNIENGANTSPVWKEYFLDKMKEFPFYTQGGTLVLLTNRELLWWMYHNLKDFYKKEGIKFYAQGINSIREIVQNFGKQGEPQVLLSLGLFWQGFDVPGEGLQNVIIPRLPFDEPSSPYNTLVLEQRKNKFIEYLTTKKELSLSKAVKIADKHIFRNFVLPRAVLTFRQGLGRLIRTEEDKGIVVVLDSRLLESSYGKRFQEFIPMPIIKSFETLKNFLLESGIAGPYFSSGSDKKGNDEDNLEETFAPALALAT